MNRHERRRQAKVTRVRLKDIRIGPIRHTTLPPLLVARIQRLHEVLKDLYDPGGIAGWIEGFQRDMHPENEVIIWEGIARAVEAFLKDHSSLPLEARKELLGLALDPRNPTKLKHLSDDQAIAFLNVFAQAWTEIRAETGFDRKHEEAQKDYG